MCVVLCVVLCGVVWCDTDCLSLSLSLSLHSVKGAIRKVRRDIGYCPQFDPLLDLMTARETLSMYALLKGIPRRSVPHVVDSAIGAINLFNIIATFQVVDSGR